jgi:hypothetical protein
MYKLILAASFSFFAATQAFGQEILADPRVEFDGPFGQTIVFSIRYFDGLKASDTIHARSELGKALEPESLEFGHTGIHVKAVAASAEPITLRLLDGEKTVATVTSKGIGEIELRFGSVPIDDSIDVPRALPSESEKQLIERFLAAISRAQTRELVSESVVANIDWQTLDSYCAALTRELGTPIVGKVPTDGWIGWEGSLGARVLAGMVNFKHGSCQFKLMVMEGKFVDVEPICPKMPSDWFAQEPTDVGVYVARAHALAAAVFAGESARAHELFSPRFYEEVSIASLEELSNKLRNELGESLVSSQQLQTAFGDWSTESTTKRLSIDSELKLESGKRCTSRVDFAIPVNKDTIAKAHLASISIREAWQSAFPRLADDATTALRLISAPNAQESTTAFQELLHPDVKLLMDSKKLEDFFTLSAQRVGRLKSVPVYSLWRATPGTQQTVVGPAIFELQGSTHLEMKFADGRLIGLTLWANDYSASTLDQIADFPDARNLGQTFWTLLLGGRLREAYELLAPDFQAQLPLAKFEELVAASNIAENASLESVQLDALRLADRDQRAQPAILAGYYNALFVDGRQLPLHCEFRRADSAGAFELINFTTDFSARFPLASSPQATAFFDAFLRGDANKVSALPNSKVRAGIDLDILQAFLDNLQAAVPPSKAPELRTSLEREYAAGKRSLLLRASLSSPSAPITVEAEFEEGHLRNFQFTHPQLASFVGRIRNRTNLEARTSNFLQTWMQGDIANTTKYLVSSLRTPSVGKRLASVCNDYVFLLGDFASHRIQSTKDLLDNNQIELDIELQFQKGVRKVRLTYDVEAFNAYISALHFPES